MCWVVHGKLIALEKLWCYICVIDVKAVRGWCLFCVFMIFGDGGFDGDALMINFEKRMSMEGIKKAYVEQAKDLLFFWS